MTARTSAERLAERAGIGARPRAVPEDSAVPAGASARRLADRVAVQAAGSDADPVAVRAWAAENGHPVSAHGPIPRRVVAAYGAAHPGKVAAEDDDPGWITPGSVYS